MEALVKKRENFHQRKNEFELLGCNTNGAATDSLTDSSADSIESSISNRSSSEASTKDVKTKGPSSPASLGWLLRNAHVCHSLVADVNEDKPKSYEDDSSKFSNTGSKLSG